MIPPWTLNVMILPEKNVCKGKGNMMKKILSYLVMIPLIFTSCGNTIFPVTDNMGPEKAENATILDAYHEFSFLPSEDGMSAEVLDNTCEGTLFYSPKYENSIVMKFGDIPCIYNDETGNIGSLCIDPLCLHKTRDCPYVGMDTGIILVNNNVYFSAYDPKIDKRVFYEVNLSSGKKRELHQRNLGLGIAAQYYDTDYTYYYEVLSEDDTANHTTSTVYIFTRQNLKTLETEELERTVDDIFDIALFGRSGNEFLFRSDVTGNLLTAPAEDITNRKIIFDGYTEFDPMMMEGDTLFFVENKDDKSILSSIKWDGSGYSTYPIENLCDFGTSFYVTEKYIYFMYDEPVKLPENDLKDEISPRKIWRMNRETEEITLAYEMDERLATVDIEQFIVKGNYIYADYTLFTDDFQEYCDSEGYLRLGIEDGSIYLIEWD